MNNFKKDLEFSLNSISTEPFLIETYKKAFCNYGYSELCTDINLQKKGIDRIVNLSNGKKIYVDEKIRRKFYPDISIEYKHVLKNGQPDMLGWVEKDLICDYIMYSFVDKKISYLYDWLFLKRAWMHYKELWKNSYFNPMSENNNYVSYNVAVPIDILNKAVQNAKIIKIS